MKISLEAEVMPLFATGIVFVLLAELLLTFLRFRKDPSARRPLIGHIACLAISFFCLGAMLFWRRATPDGDVHNSSGLFAFFGIFWFVSECFSISAFVRSRKTNDHPKEQSEISG